MANVQNGEEPEVDVGVEMGVVVVEDRESLVPVGVKVSESDIVGIGLNDKDRLGAIELSLMGPGPNVNLSFWRATIIHQSRGSLV